MSDEALRFVVADAYTRYLRRGVDPGGRDYWVHKIQAGTREETIVAEILGFRRVLPQGPTGLTDRALVSRSGQGPGPGSER